MLPIRSEQYLLHTDDERAQLLQQRQERVNVLLDLGVSQETIDQADARVLEIVEADEIVKTAVTYPAHDEIRVEFSDAADARFAAAQKLRRFMLDAPDVLQHVKIIADPPIMKRWIKDAETPTGRIQRDLDAQFLAGAGAFPMPRGLRFWSGEPGFMAVQPDYNALEQRVLQQSLEAMRRLPKHAISHSFDFGCRCTMVRDFLAGERPLKHKRGDVELRGNVKTTLSSGIFDGAMIDAEGAALAGVET